MMQKKKLGAAFGAAALATALLASGSSAAMAAPDDYGNVDPSQLGSLTLHKYLHSDADPAPEGDVAGGANTGGDFGDPVEGVEFTVYPLLQDGSPVDLTDYDAWGPLADLEAGADCTAPTGYTLGAPMVMPLTDATGASLLGDLPVTVYQVCETDAPANVIDRAEPFIVSIPMPHEDGWLYNVHAYPKNGDATVDKTIEAQEGYGLGSLITFPVSTEVPRISKTWTSLTFTDTLDARLTPSADDVAVTVDGVDLNPDFYTLDVTDQTITVDFTAAGLAWLNEGPNAHVGEEIVVDFAGVITDIGDGTIDNIAQVTFNGTELPTPEVSTNWGDLNIVKRGAGTEGEEGLLSGATFEVYAASAPYTADCTSAEPTGDPIEVDGLTEFTSVDGIIDIDGLFVSDSENPAVDAEQRCYVLKETAAPAGYVLPDDPFTPVAITIGDTTGADIEIENTQQPAVVLPTSGAIGQLILTITAGAAALGAALLVIARRRKATA